MEIDRKRIDYLDQMRGIAIILVVIGHVMQFSLGFGTSHLVDLIGIFHMPSFFFISGFLSYSSQNNRWFELVFKRFKRLCVPFVVFSLAWCFCYQENWIELLKWGGGRYWFLLVLFEVFALFMFVDQLTKCIKKDYIRVLSFLFPIILLIILEKVYPTLELYIHPVAKYYRYFIIGFFCSKYKNLDTCLFKNDFIYAVAFCVLILQWYFCSKNITILIFAGALSGIVLLRYFCENYNGNNRIRMFLILIGKKSLLIYVLHYFFLVDISDIGHVVLDVSNGFFLQLITSIVISFPIIFFCIVIGWFIESNKYLSIIMLGHNGRH